MQCSSQKGYGLLLILAVILMVAGFVSSSYFKNLISYFSSKQLQLEVVQMQQVKERLLRFAVLQPEIYLTNSDSQLLDASAVPAPGYFPCPDLDGDGFLLGAETTCGNVYLPSASHPNQTGFVPDPLNNNGSFNCDGSVACMGYVPQKIVSRELYFAPAQRYFYVLDERFSFQNGYHVNHGLKRFAPLSPSVFSNRPARLYLNGVGDYVLLIIDAGKDGLDAPNADGDYRFVSPGRTLDQDTGADKIIGVTFNEWRRLMTIRACLNFNRFHSSVNNYPPLIAGNAHWLNSYHSVNNPAGGGWRQQCGG